MALPTFTTTLDQIAHEDRLREAQRQYGKRVRAEKKGHRL